MPFDANAAGIGIRAPGSAIRFESTPVYRTSMSRISNYMYIAENNDHVKTGIFMQTIQFINSYTWTGGMFSPTSQRHLPGPLFLVRLVFPPSLVSRGFPFLSPWAVQFLPTAEAVFGFPQGNFPLPRRIPLHISLPTWAWIFKLLKSPRIDSYEPMPPGCVACAGIFEQSMRARNRVRIVLSYRPARLHRQGELVPYNRFSGSFKV